MGAKPSGISGSRAAAILGLSEWSTLFEAWQIIKEEQFPGYAQAHGYILPPFEQNAAMRWGTAFESAIVSLTEQKTGQKIRHRERIFSDDYLTCHVDGLFEPINEILFEGKSTNTRSFWQKWGEPGTDWIPTSYACQVQHNMMLSGAERCIVGVLVFPKMVDEWDEMGVIVERDIEGDWWVKAPGWINTATSWSSILAEMGFFHTYEIAANPAVQKSMREVYADFWGRYIMGSEEPKPGCYDDVKRLFPSPVGTVIATEQVERWITEYDEIGKETSKSGTLGKRREELKTLVLDAVRKMDATMDEASREKTLIMSSTGKKLASWDSKAFR